MRGLVLPPSWPEALAATPGNARAEATEPAEAAYNPILRAQLLDLGVLSRFKLAGREGMLDTGLGGDTRLDCAALARALGIITPISDLPTSLQLPEMASCWVGPEAPALIRLMPRRSEADSAPPPLLWIATADIKAAPRYGLSAPVISTLFHSSEALTRIQRLIDTLLDLTRPGTLVRVYGHGVLLQGESGVGKSETALMLLERGHSLITDDAVRIQAQPNGELLGSAPSGPMYGQLALHGLGLLKVNQLFGETAVASSAVIRMIVTLTANAPPADPLLGAWTAHGWLGRTLPRLALSNLRPRGLLIETAVRQIQARTAHKGDFSVPSGGEQMRELL